MTWFSGPILSLLGKVYWQLIEFGLWDEEKKSKEVLLTNCIIDGLLCNFYDIDNKFSRNWDGRFKAIYFGESK